MFLFQTTKVEKIRDAEIKDNKIYMGNEQAIKTVMDNLGTSEKNFRTFKIYKVADRIATVKKQLEEKLKATDKPIAAEKWEDLKNLTNSLGGYAVNAAYYKDYKDQIEKTLTKIEVRAGDITTNILKPAEAGGFYKEIKVGFKDGEGYQQYDVKKVLDKVGKSIDEMMAHAKKVKEIYQVDHLTKKVEAVQGIINDLTEMKATFNELSSTIDKAPIIGDKNQDVQEVISSLFKLERSLEGYEKPKTYWLDGWTTNELEGKNGTKTMIGKIKPALNDALEKVKNAQEKVAEADKKKEEERKAEEPPEKREPEKIEKKKEKEEQKPNLNYGAVFGKNAPVPSPESVTGTTPEDVLNRYIYRRALEINPKFEGLTLTKERVDQNRDKAIEYMQSRGWLEADFDYKATEMSANELKLFDAYFTMLCGRGKIETNKVFNKLGKAEDEAGRAEVVQANVLALLTVRKDDTWKEIFKGIVVSADDVIKDGANDRPGAKKQEVVVTETPGVKEIYDTPTAFMEDYRVKQATDVIAIEPENYKTEEGKYSISNVMDAVKAHYENRKEVDVPNEALAAPAEKVIELADKVETADRQLALLDKMIELGAVEEVTEKTAGSKKVRKGAQRGTRYQLTADISGDNSIQIADQKDLMKAIYDGKKDDPNIKKIIEKKTNEIYSEIKTLLVTISGNSDFEAQKSKYSDNINAFVALNSPDLGRMKDFADALRGFAEESKTMKADNNTTIIGLMAHDADVEYAVKSKDLGNDEKKAMLESIDKDPALKDANGNLIKEKVIEEINKPASEKINQNKVVIVSGAIVYKDIEDAVAKDQGVKDILKNYSPEDQKEIISDAGKLWKDGDEYNTDNIIKVINFAKDAYNPINE